MSYGPISPAGIYVSYYGCCRCQRQHWEDEAHDLYRTHLGFQSRHGVGGVTIEERLRHHLTLPAEVDDTAAPPPATGD